MTNQTIFEILADGLDASTDGRGWGAEHERARVLANAAPAMAGALRWAEKELSGFQNMTGTPDAKLAEIRGILAQVEGTPTAAAPGATGEAAPESYSTAREWVNAYDAENYGSAGGYDGGGFTHDDMVDAFEAGARMKPAPHTGEAAPITDFAGYAEAIVAAHGYVTAPDLWNPPSRAQVAHLLALSGISCGPIASEGEG